MTEHSTIPVAARPLAAATMPRQVIGGMDYNEWQPEESYPTRLARLAKERDALCGQPTKAGNPCPNKRGDAPMCSGHALKFISILSRL